MSLHHWQTIDCHYLFPRFAAAFLRLESGRAVFIENNTTHAVPFLLAALEAQKISPDRVDYLMVTHAHLDHAGATGKLVRLFPNALVLAHPKAARTLMDPSRLVASAKKVYGENQFNTLFGEITPVPPERIRALSDGEKWNWQGLEFESLFTDGHASHHLCFFEKNSNSIFTGDAFGLSYPDIRGKKAFHIPSTSPVDFNCTFALLAIDRILKTGADRAFLTHFGEIQELRRQGEILKKHLLFHQSLIEDCDKNHIPDSEVEGHIHAKLGEYFVQELRESGVSMTPVTEKILKLDLDLNAAGLAFACLKRRKHIP